MNTKLRKQSEIEPRGWEESSRYKLYELVDGVFAEEPDMGNEASRVGARLINALAQFCYAHDLGEIYEAHVKYRCFPGKPKQTRSPDASFMPADRLSEVADNGFTLVAPALAAEVISRTDLALYIEKKVEDYRSAGIQLIWLIYPNTRTALVRRLDGTTTEVGPDGSLSGEGVLPGFTLPLTELFRRARPPQA